MIFSQGVAEIKGSGNSKFEGNKVNWNIVWRPIRKTTSWNFIFKTKRRRLVLNISKLFLTESIKIRTHLKVQSRKLSLDIPCNCHWYGIQACLFWWNTTSRSTFHRSSPCLCNISVLGIPYHQFGRGTRTALLRVGILKISSSYMLLNPVTYGLRPTPIPYGGRDNIAPPPL